MALRSIWNGTIAFAGVFVPVKVHSATEDRTVHFHDVHVDDGARISTAGSARKEDREVPYLDLHFRQLHEKDKVPVETQRWCSEEDKQVPYEAVTRSHELDGGKTVIVTDEDLEAVEPRRTRTIDIEQFVDLADVDPIEVPSGGEAEPEAVPDLMAALKEALAAAK